MRRKPTPPEVDAEKCTGCGLCAKVCPSFVIDMCEGRAEVARGMWCIGCGHCGAICPVEAVLQRQTAVADAPKQGPEPAISPDTLQLLLRERRSIRHYQREPIPRAVLVRILEAGRYAPTGTNSQDVHYVALTSPEEIAKLRAMTESFYEKVFKRVGSKVGSLFISMLAGRKTLEYLRGFLPVAQYIGERQLREVDPVLHHAQAVLMVHAESWDPCSAFNCAVALYNCSLMAHTLAVGCCFNGLVEGAVNNDRRIKRWLNVPKDHRCFGTMTLGYPEVKFERLVERDKPKVQWR